MFPPEPFFPSEKLSIAEMIFRNRPDDDVAIFFASQEMTGVEQVKWRDLRERTRKIRSSLRASGVGVGDVVAAVMSNSVDAITIALATLSLGAVWSSTSCDLGAGGILDRYSQVGPKIIFADNGYTYAKETLSLQERIETWSVGFQDLQNELSNVVVIPNCSLRSDVSRIYRGCTFAEFLGRGSDDKLEFDLMPFSHPAFILFSSGTTGKPKCIVHSTGGVALKVKTDMSLQHDIRQSDVVFQYTTTSWVMWVLNFVNLSCAKAMLLYDGSPFHPGPTRLLNLAQEVG
ncbi:hypothetical protein NW762_014618 [Fusarium torreyae]|uniref:AMP-dependent synthetase/ligase domain-containing protein n=1 Tax=Fusarium torreyae TaxID=1237075 RepID=A0A9W8RIB8_9HYPO|nr:hypothetical protein NW762_014618 [Fusarium torreyae]